MIITFGALGLAICCVWLKPIRFGNSFLIPPWVILFASAVVAGLATGYLKWPAVIELALVGFFAFIATRKNVSRTLRVIFGFLVAVFSLALAMHKLPGFNNPLLISNERFSSDAVPFTLYANFDKAAVGLILLAFLCKRAHSISEWWEEVRQTYLILLATSVLVIGLAIAIGYTKPNLKFPSVTLLFVAVNLLFTCVAEEAFFRGYLQDRLATSISTFRFAVPASVVISALLFGAVHFAGGPAFMLLATLSGLGAAVAYAMAGRIEAPIMVHFLFNTVHFIGFTYPRLQ